MKKNDRPMLLRRCGAAHEQDQGTRDDNGYSQRGKPLDKTWILLQLAANGLFAAASGVAIDRALNDH
jgi:hypothetical protein